MFFNCGFIFIGLLAVILSYVLTSQRRHSIILFCSLFLGVLGLGLTYIVFYNINYIPRYMMKIISFLFSNVKTFSNNDVLKLSYASILLLVFFSFFALGEVIFNNVVSRDEYLQKATTSNILMKYAFIFLNIILSSFIFIFILTFLHLGFAYKEGFLGMIIRLYEGALSLL